MGFCSSIGMNRRLAIVLLGLQYFTNCLVIASDLDYLTESEESDKTNFLRDCPAGCDCRLLPLLEVDCSFLNLREVPSLSPSTESLDLSMNNISKIQLASFEKLRQLKILRLSGNSIEELPLNVLNRLKKLEGLHLQDNHLKTILPNAINRLPNLKNLNLGANYISSISSNAFAKLESLEHVWLDDNKLTEIPARALKKAPKIKALNIGMNKITAVRNGNLDDLPSLEVLLLKHNYITSIENNAFERSPKIRIIDLSYNNLASLPSAINDAQKLVTLTLSSNHISSLSDFAFAGNPELEELTLTGNPIKSVDRTAFTGLKNLKDLSLENAEDLKDFPDLSGCNQLRSLVITGGKLRRIPVGFCASVPNLQKLLLSRNRLQNISGLLQCSKLTDLDVSDNELTEVTFSETRNLTKMRSLNLGHNKIRQLDQDVFSTTNYIETLNLAGNLFTFLPMRGLRSLRDLNISGVRTMLYLPPVALFHNLRSLSAYYPYHCCQVAKIPTKVDNAGSRQLQRSRSWMSPSPIEDGLPRTSPVQCSPGPGPMTPCDDLLPSTPIRVFWWIAMVLSFLLNGVILVSCAVRYCIRRRSRRPTAVPSDEEMLRRTDSESPYTSDNRVVVHDSDASTAHYCLNFSQSGNMISESDTFDFSLCHLTLADFFVTLYTAIVLSYDESTRGEFAVDGAWWQQSPLCHSAGFLLTFGTQLAFCTVIVMSIERYLATMHPLQTERHMRKNMLIAILCLAWIISVVTGIVTLFGRAGDEEADSLLNKLPAKRGATCLPWTTEFTYVAILVGLHVVGCLLMCVVCALMFCARRKQSWLSPRKNTRTQVTLAVLVNIFFILPLVLLTVFVSGYMTYSDLTPGYGGEYSAPEDGRVVLDMGSLLSFAMFVIPFRPLLNPILYMIFNKPLRKDLAYLTKKAIMNPSNRRTPFQRRNNSVLEPMFDSVGDNIAPTELPNSFPLFNRTYNTEQLVRPAMAYDNRGVASSSSVSYHAPSMSLAPSSNRAGGSNRTSSERKRRRRYTRSQRGDRRTTDTDPTTESEIITFHRGCDAVYYDPDARDKRRKKLTSRYGGVNAKDEFQRLYFPRGPKTSSSDHGSDSTVYPIMPSTISALTTSSCMRHIAIDGSSKNLSCDADASDVSSTDCASERHQHPWKHCDSNRKMPYGVSVMSSSITPITSLIQRDFLPDGQDETCVTDSEVAGITSVMLEDFQEENPFFEDRDTTVKLQSDAALTKLSHARPKEENRNDVAPPSEGSVEQICRIYHANDPLLRQSSHSSSNTAEARLVGRIGNISGSCDYCDSSASKDSGIHSEIDSTSGASYSDTSIGRRLHYSTSISGLKVTTSSPNDNTVVQYDLPSRNRDFEIIPSLDSANTIKSSPISNIETAI